MQLGKSLLGAIVGAAVGIVLLLVVYLTLHIDKMWLSIPFAIITGLGVRMFVSTAGHASYVRGAMTMVLALAGYIGGWQLAPKVVTAAANAQSPKPPAAAAAAEQPAGETAEAKDKEAAEPKDAAAPVEQPKAATTPAEKPQPRPAAAKSFGSTWDVIWLAIAALVAYEMGRGSGIATKSVESSPAGTHPDA
jgi:hypothetical protein